LDWRPKSTLNSGNRKHSGGRFRRGSVHWSNGQFDAICNRLARGLRRHGVAFGDRVAMLARNSRAYAAMRFAVARLGPAALHALVFISHERLICRTVSVRR